MLTKFLTAKSNNIFKCRHKEKRLGKHQGMSNNPAVREQKNKVFRFQKTNPNSSYHGACVLSIHTGQENKRNN